MSIRLNKGDKAEFATLYIEAVKLQVQLYDKLGEIEGVTGMVNGLDEAVRGEASNWTEPDLVKLHVADINAALAELEREK
jgi:hypothetical protein